MATKTLNVRLTLRHDTFENWNAANPVLLNGEVALAVIPAGATSGLNEPCLIAKAGDGTTNYKNLPYMSALAADVLTACKSTEGLNTFITNLLTEKGLLSADGGETASMTERMTQAETDIDNLQKADDEIRAEIAAKIASTYKPSGSVAAVADLPAASEVNLGKVYNVTADFTTTADFLEGADKTVPAGSNVVIVEKTPAVKDDQGTVTTPATYAYDVVGSFINMDNYMTKTETTDAIKTAKDEAIAAVPAEVNKALTPVEGQPESAVLTTVKGIVDGKIGALDFTDTAVDGEFVTSVSETDGVISVNRAKVTAEKVDGLTSAVETAVTNALTPSTDPNAPENPVLAKVEGIVDEKVTAAKNELLGDSTTADGTGNTIADVKKVADKNKTDIATLNGDATTAGSVDKKVADAKNELLGDSATADGTGNTVADAKKVGADNKTAIDTLNSDVTTPGSVAKSVKDAVDALNVTDTAVDGQFVTAVSEDKGLISVTRKTLTLADISDSTTDEIILNCGNSGASATPVA